MDKAYDHKKYESQIYKLWEKSGAFKPEIQKSKKPFCIIMPPPNANNPLHIGHAREVATQDILIRYHRMKGEAVLWLPGADHAGIETQYVFEGKLAKINKSRFDYDSSTLFKMIWDDVQANRHIMEDQLRKLGASCDWSRAKFTLDGDIVSIVNQTFKKLYDDGLVYRGERIVNYCTRCGTSFSELEVNHVERDDNFYFLDYGIITIATTRPETIFADVAVAVNPKDKRYSGLIGKMATIPLINRQIPIISDSLVEMEFGTGALKITPAHDTTDFEIGQRHQLPIISVIDSSGFMINTPKKYVGLNVKRAREAVFADLEDEKKIKKIETIHHNVGACYRCKSTIEPMISKQWFVKVKPLVEGALAAISKKDVKFVAPKYEKIAKHWLKNLNDWNVSRQIVWGIQIPAWRCEKCFEWTVTEGETPSQCKSCKARKLTRDMDTFDTWFSSSQWPFATLKTTDDHDFDYFYPTSVMDPSYDILPFWVIRMIMLGIYLTGKVPFRYVLLHGLVRDKNGVKISKSKGNVIDPIEMTERYGSDALRAALVWGVLVESDNSLSEEAIRGQRNFANKLWNVARFVDMYQDNNNEKGVVVKPKTKNVDDLKILKELNETIKAMTKLLDKYRLNEAAKELYDFIWNSFANDYLAKTKARQEEAQPVLRYVLRETLKIAHPFLPFVSELIWQNNFAQDRSDLLIISTWPKAK
ncbi:valine--tRNA ligase [Candidatus Woesebacteria bacterium RIFOXYB1_FULL_38_16]|uniref:Valine--tRNA ligase n=1 Tax=Candidatus Woesebacteria bacterium RIFOXYB1_FULL_38_16 TaxID=1802538 RepID=A0A1F8CTY9_9BACT|nr:MAG: valine--tRNA ligase [Candidatus Woesebacteria bacterium RIFOXYA1_FULL_38_9]OGM79794.1 MAG: valine--tRNA ligase [Candidatus Woesebacteria bacterium RIFOXYB1_FULL_38_16]